MMRQSVSNWMAPIVLASNTSNWPFTLELAGFSVLLAANTSARKEISVLSEKDQKKVT